MDCRIFIMRTDVNACDCTRECTDTERKSARKVDSGKRIFATPGNWTCISGVTVWCSKQLSYIPSHLVNAVCKPTVTHSNTSLAACLIQQQWVKRWYYVCCRTDFFILLISFLLTMMKVFTVTLWVAEGSQSVQQCVSSAWYSWWITVTDVFVLNSQVTTVRAQAWPMWQLPAMLASTALQVPTSPLLQMEPQVSE